MSNFNLNNQNLNVNNEVETTVSKNSNFKNMKKINFTVNPAYEQTECIPETPFGSKNQHHPTKQCAGN